MKRSILFLLIAAVAMSSCNLSGYKKTKSGLYYKIVSSGGKTPMKPGQFAKIQMIGYVHDSLFFNTNEGLPYYTPIDSVGRPHDVTELLKFFGEGDSVIVIQSVDTLTKMPGFRMPPFFHKGDKIKSYLKVVKVYNTLDEAQKSFEADKVIAAGKEEIKNKAGYEKAQKELDDYIAKNKINATKTADGIYVEVKQPGTGVIADLGKMVGVKYRGTLLSGTLFDTNIGPDRKDTLTYPLGQMIKGFDLGIKGQKEGAQIRVFIPAKEGYGADGRGDVIKPFDNLIFDINLLTVKDMEAAKK
ncbi:MAG: FKBP-type peptidyl-prolyl cis-trans isomerase [Sphingobacteriales bacterium]|nr:FKBP-type peptidyl-prolyl cis-trans isomerase [Sphingobacteriales bacterium]